MQPGLGGSGGDQGGVQPQYVAIIPEGPDARQRPHRSGSPTQGGLQALQCAQARGFAESCTPQPPLIVSSRLRRPTAWRVVVVLSFHNDRSFAPHPTNTSFTPTSNSAWCPLHDAEC